MEERSKEEILSELYAIRAAMSLVSQKNDVTDQYQNANERSRRGIENSLQRVSNAAETQKQQSSQYLIEPKMQELSHQMNTIKEEIDDKKKKVEKEKAQIDYLVGEESRRYRYEPSKPAKFFGILMAISVFLALIGQYFTLEWQAGVYIGVLYGTIVLATIIYALVYHAKVMAPTEADLQKISDKRQELALLENRLAELNREYERAQKQSREYSALLEQGTIYYDTEAIARLEREQRQLQKHEKAVCQEANQAIKNRRAKIALIAKESQEIIESARGLYTVIDFRDWANVDLIIFYYETGRADTMKEALQQVDRQRQNDTLVRAIGMATEMLAKTIRQSVSALEKTLEGSFRRLSMQLEFQHRTSMDEVSKLGAKLETQNEQLEKLGEQAEELRLSAEAQARVQAANQEMTNALLEKIDVSSTQLAYDMEMQMRLVHHIPV